MKKVLLAALLGAASLSPALAQTDSHWYGALDFGTLTMKDSNFPDANAMGLRGGYRFTRHLAAEAGLLFVGDSTYTNTNGTYTARQSGLSFTAVGFLPLGQSFELFAKAGLGFHSVRISGTGGPYDPYTTTNIIYGAGAQFNFTPNFGMRLQYENLGRAKSSPTDAGVDISRASVGATFSF